MSQDDPVDTVTPPARRFPKIFTKHEQFWVDNQPFILSRGYRLRPRYDPDWVPSWSTRVDPKGEYEDDLHPFMSCPVLDAIRIGDGKKVVFKRVPTDGPELNIAMYLSSPEMRSDSRNHTVPIEVISLPHDSSWTFLVMPYCRSFDYPPFHCRAEFLEAMRQYLEGLQFMHDHKVSHFDIAPQNLMMDESRVVPRGSHFCRPRTHNGFYNLFSWKNRCSVGPVEYYYIDFGLSMYFPDGKDTALTLGTLRTFKTIPELSLDVPYNPFKVDVFQLGLTMHKIIKTYPALSAFRPVADNMMKPNPQDRPEPSDSLAHLNSIAARMSSRKLRASIWEKKGIFNHLTRQVLGGYLNDHPPSETI
ncbi:kinase-like domain-containing protein [Mycena sp. CBHHK59/15]|nr:kinase-like domain-containing protein [Mycena sp. CBHHK59/15]